jgi:hypothetical protein
VEEIVIQLVVVYPLMVCVKDVTRMEVMMSDAQIVISVIFAVIFFVILIFNVVSYPNVELFKKKYSELERGVYKYEPDYGESHYFYLYSYDIHTLTFTRTDVDIIFFLDGDIKLSHNLYIHKSHLFMSLVSWYYWRKFQRLKDDTIKEHNIREGQRRRAQNLFDERSKLQNNLNFKFLRG